jgi:hypothetical protein
LLAQIGRANHQQAATTLRPSLGEQYSGFNRLSQSDFIGKDRPFGQRGTEREQSSFNLVRV